MTIFRTTFRIKVQAHTIPWEGSQSLRMESTNFLLAGIKIHKATGPNGIPGRHLKELASELAPICTTMYQASFDQGRVPLDWKTALVTPAFKKGNSNKAENYRPVSLTSVCCKQAEHIIHSNAMRHLENLRILTDSAWNVS